MKAKVYIVNLQNNSKYLLDNVLRHERPWDVYDLTAGQGLDDERSLVSLDCLQTKTRRVSYGLTASTVQVILPGPPSGSMVEPAA